MSVSKRKLLRSRLLPAIEVIANLRDLIDVAHTNGWTGEVGGLRTSLNAAGAKLASLDRMNARP